MKRFLALLFSFCIIFNSATSIEAKSLDSTSTTYIEYINDDLYAEITLSQSKDVTFQANSFSSSISTTRVASNRKTTSKTYFLKNKSGKVLAKYTLTGTFTYNGSSSTCTKASCSTSVSDSTYSFSQKAAWASGNTAIGSFTLSSSKQTLSKTLTLTCSANGNIQ